MKLNFLEWSFDFMQISQNRNHVFLLRSTFVINNSDQKSIYKKFMCAFKGIFFVNMQVERRTFGPKHSQKTTFKDQDGILIKIFNDKSWPQQEDLFWNLENLEKSKTNSKK